jgi:GMP synthase (glutamine-hydrolysing)
VKNVLLLKAGEAAPSVRLSVGDYDRWFLQTLGLSSHRFDIIPAYQGAKLPRSVARYDAVLMTGSPLSVTRLEPWMERAAELMVGAAARGIPVLGVCFGHQLLAHAYGGRVVRNPLGREIGTVEVRLTEAGRADPLFHGQPERLTVQATHEDIVLEPPEGAVVLAGNLNTAIQALAFRPYARGVQFHPEMQPDAMRALIQARAKQLEAEATARGQPARERVPRLLAGIAPTPAGRQLLVNFLERFH